MKRHYTVLSQSLPRPHPVIDADVAPATQRLCRNRIHHRGTECTETVPLPFFLCVLCATNVENLRGARGFLRIADWPRRCRGSVPSPRGATRSVTRTERPRGEGMKGSGVPLHSKNR